MSSNPPLEHPPLTLAVAYKRWHGWRDAVYGRIHPSKRARVVAYARRSLRFAGKMRYTEGPGRSELFHRPRGAFSGASADCSQDVAAIHHWIGVRKVTDKDWTGTLYEKGRKLAVPVPGCIVIFGDAPGVHTAIMDTKTTCIGFGQQAGPDQNTLASMLAYFAGRGVHGHVFRDLTV